MVTRPPDEKLMIVSEEVITTPDTTKTAVVFAKRRKLTYPERAVRYGVKHIGNHESPLGSNRCSYNRHWLRVDGVPWCASTLSYFLDRVGNKNRRVPWDNPYAVDSIAKWAAENNRFVTKPRRGDIYLIQNASMSHCGLVRKVKGSRFLDLSGNTTLPGKRGAFYVASKWRRIAGVRFIRLPDQPF